MKSILQKLSLLVFLSFFTTPLIQSQNVLNFDGVNDYVDCGNILPISYTKEALIKITALGANNIISGPLTATSQHVFWASDGNGGKLSAGNGTNYAQVIDATALQIGQWYHVAVTYDAATLTMRLYKNGLEVSAAIGSVSPVTDPIPRVYIGAFGSNFVFAGNMSNVRIWDIARSAGDIAANVNTTFTTAQTNLICNYTCNQGAGTPHIGVSDLANIPSETNNGILFEATFITASVVLPVELLSFKAVPLTGSPSNLLKWQTANELNNKGFQVERLKASGSDWEILGFVAAKGKQANYEFTDNTPISMSYYRLRQMDYDGKEVLSNVVSLAVKAAKGLKVYPNIISNGFLTVDGSTTQDNTEGAIYGIYNLLGQQILKGQVTQQIDVSALPTGTYVIKVGTEQAKFVKP